MQIRVDKDNLRIIKLSQLESGEVDVTEVEFIFTPEYKDLIKTAVFTLGDKSYKVILQNDKCFIPTEVLVEGNKITIGVYAFKQDREELILRYSPVPVTAEILKGSYVEEAENTSHPTPTEIEQLLDLINSNSIAIDDLTERVDTLEEEKDKCCSDIDSIKEDLIDIKADIQDLEDDVTSIRSDINNINENIDDIEGEIDTLEGNVSDINTSITNINQLDERQNRRLNSIDNFIRQWPKTEYKEGTSINLGKTIQATVQYEDDKVLHGDTEQDTTNGYNLWGGFNEFSTGNFVTKTNGTITFGSCDFGATSATTTLAIANNLLITLEAGTYTISCTGINSNFNMNIVKRSGTSGSIIKSLSTTTPSGQLVLEETSEVFARIGAIANNTETGTAYIMIEKGSTEHDWEPYTGEIPAPNPSYPQPISVVTGTQEVAVKNGDNETQATYTIHLGNLELAKIGDYQDYIYFDVDEGKWYKKGLVGKYTFTGDENYTLSGTANVFYIQNWANNILISGDNRPFCTSYKSTAPVSSVSGMANKNMNTIAVPSTASGSGNLKRLYFKTDSYTTTNEIAIGNKDKVVYYLVTPTTTEITDTTLIQDLDNILAMMSVEGNTIIEVSGNLPATIKVRAFAQLQAAT